LDYTLNLKIKLDQGWILSQGEIRVYSPFMAYRTRHITKLFDISEETVRVWVGEFAEYLSPTATPGKHKQRVFTEADMEVLSLVSERKKQGDTFADIHLSLKNGQRGNITQLPPEELDAIVSTDRESRLAFENDHLQRMLVESQEQLKVAQRELEELHAVRDENIRLKAQLDSSQSHQERLEAMIDRLSKRIEEITMQAGREYGKGIMDALREKGEFRNSDEE
jgi:DNA-binding transcriptional MerR regulator